RCIPMLLNSYGVLDAFVASLRIFAGLLTLGLGVSVWWGCRATPATDSEPIPEGRTHLLFLLAFLLLGLNIACWPLFYLLLQSYVGEVRGAMCIYGVLRVGTGTIGPSRFLPGLVQALQLTKPALVFLSGAWLVLYLLNRATVTAPLLPRVLLLLM